MREGEEGVEARIRKQQVSTSESIQQFRSGNWGWYLPCCSLAISLASAVPSHVTMSLMSLGLVARGRLQAPLMSLGLVARGRMQAPLMSLGFVARGRMQALKV